MMLPAKGWTPPTRGKYNFVQRDDSQGYRRTIQMHRVMVDAATIRQLEQSESVTEICDSAGNVIGTFRPCRVPRDLLDSDEGPREELIRQGRLRTGRPFADVIADLERRP